MHMFIVLMLFCFWTWIYALCHDLRSLIIDDEYEFVGKRILELNVLDLHFAAEAGLTFIYAPTFKEVPHRQIVPACDIGHLWRHEDSSNLFISSHDQL